MDRDLIAVKILPRSPLIPKSFKNSLLEKRGLRRLTNLIISKLYMYPELEKYIQTIKNNVADIAEKRRAKLETIADYIRKKMEADEVAKLNFICTHNSRRSHLCQIWLTVLSDYFGLDNVQTFSGGTESTAFNPRAVEAIRRAGFQVDYPGGDNPRYKVYFDEDKQPLICFSKTFDNSANPSANFAAVMTCSDADKNCPHVPGADHRFSIPYIDPKEADGTDRETETYDERCRQIATEMFYLISKTAT